MFSLVEDGRTIDEVFQEMPDTEAYLQLGRERFSIEFPESWGVFEPPDLPRMQLADETAGTLPGAERLAEILAGRRRALLVIDDDYMLTRVSPALTPLAERLVEAGVAKSRISIFVGCGKGENILGRRLVRLVGERACGEYETIVNSPEAEYDERGRNVLLRDPDTLVVLLMPDIVGVEADYDRHPLRALFPGSVSPEMIAEVLGDNNSTTEIFRKTISLWLPKPDQSLDAEPPAGYVGLLVRQDPLGRTLGVEWLDNPADAFGGKLDSTPPANSGVKKTLVKQFRCVLTSCGGAPADAAWFHVLRTVLDAAPRVADGGLLAVAADAEEGVCEDGWLSVLQSLARGEPLDISGLSPESRFFAARLADILHRINLRLLGPGFVPAEDDSDDEALRRALPDTERLKAYGAGEEAWSALREEIEKFANDTMDKKNDEGELRVAVCPRGPWWL